MRVVGKYCFALGVNLSRRFFAYALNDNRENYRHLERSREIP